MLDPFFGARLNVIQFEIHVSRCARRDNVGVIDKTTRFDQLNGVKGATTAIALVASSVLESTMWTNSFDIAVSQEPMNYVSYNKTFECSNLLGASLAISLLFLLFF